MKLTPNDDDRLWREPEETSWFRSFNPLRYVIFIILLTGVLIGLWHWVAPTRQYYSRADLPLIQADQTPYKIKATNQGVPSVKHQDKLVYGRIRADQNEPVAEHILPDPEAPLPQIKEPPAPIKMVDQYTPEEGDPDKVAEPIEKEPEESAPSLTSIEDLIAGTPEEKLTPVSENQESVDEKQAPEKINVKGKTHIQLGSLKSYDLAESEWKRLSKKHPDVLRGLDPIIQKVDLGEEKGIYYRLRTGPFVDMEKANAVCSALKEQKAQCVVVQ